MIYRPDKQKIEDYFASPAMNQSRLKLLPKGVDYFNAAKDETESEVMFYEEKTHFILGHAAELKLQQGAQEFINTYHMSDIKKPSDKLMSIAQQIFDIQSRVRQPDEPFLLLTNDNLEEDIISAIQFHEYYPKWTMPVKIARVRTDCQDYYNDLIKSYGKQILDLDEITIIDAIVNSLQENERTKRFFTNPDQQGIDYIYQFPIYFTYQGMDFRVLIDILEINHINKTLKVLDIKTIGDFTVRFPSSVRKFRYDFQVAFYTIAVSQWKKDHPQLKDYRVINPAFIVETTKLGYQGNPLIFDCSDQLIDIAMYGRKLFSISQHYDDRNILNDGPIQTSELNGVLDTIKLYKWHLENGFEVDKAIRESDMKRKPLILDWEGIIE